MALLPDHTCQGDLASGRLVRVFLLWATQPAIVHLVFRTRRRLAPAVRALIEHLVVGCSGVKLTLSDFYLRDGVSAPHPAATSIACLAASGDARGVPPVATAPHGACHRAEAGRGILYELFAALARARHAR